MGLALESPEISEGEVRASPQGGMSGHRTGTNRGWRGCGSGQGQGHFHRHSASCWGWPQGEVTRTLGRLFCPGWEKRKEVEKEHRQGRVTAGKW